jgi:hypothetical protein
MNFKTIHDMEFESYTEKHAATSEMNCHKDVFFSEGQRLMDFLLLVVSSELDDIKLKSMLEGSPAALRLNIWSKCRSITLCQRMKHTKHKVLGAYKTRRHSAMTPP